MVGERLAPGARLRNGPGAITDFIAGAFFGVDVVVGTEGIAIGDQFFFYDRIAAWTRSGGFPSPPSSPRIMATSTARRT
jgi:hypothetical protein